MWCYEALFECYNTFPVRSKHLRDAAIFNLSSAGEKAGSLARSEDFNQSGLTFKRLPESAVSYSQSQAFK